MLQQIDAFFHEHITGADSQVWITLAILGFIAASSVLSFYCCRAFESVAMFFIRKSPTTWDDDLLNRRFLTAVSQLMPAIVVAWMLPAFFSSDTSAVNWVKIVTKCYILWTVVYILNVFITNLFKAFTLRERFRVYAIKGIFQMVRLIVIGVGVILTVSILINRSPGAILMTLGASAAILMLVFKDTILGLVASVQLTANNMLGKGDWIVVDSHGANGEVIDVSLTTVKVRNWDNSITTVPPYTLISESFKNYKPMQLSGGRRVDRSILIDANSVRFCTEAELEVLRSRGWLEGLGEEAASRTVNLRLLRIYLENYLNSDERVNHSMISMVRQMEPTATGLPLQLYFFTKTTEWKAFEMAQSDIFDHIYAVIHEFGLKVYQIASSEKIK